VRFTSSRLYKRSNATLLGVSDRAKSLSPFYTDPHPSFSSFLRVLALFGSPNHWIGWKEEPQLKPTLTKLSFPASLSILHGRSYNKTCLLASERLLSLSLSSFRQLVCCHIVVQYYLSFPSCSLSFFLVSDPN
jgi:hypothetical protein